MTAATAATGNRAVLARSGLIAFAGSLINGLAAFGVVIAITRGQDTATAAGAVFSAMAVFNIAYIVCTLGGEVALVRAVARDDSAEAPTVRTALIPSALLSVVVAVTIVISRHSIARLIGDEASADALARSLLAVAPFIPAATITTLLLATTRGRGTMTPTAVIERISRPGSQLLLVVSAGVLGFGVGTTALAWALAFGLALLPSLAWFAKDAPTSDTRPTENTVGNYWTFAGPQAITTVLQVLLRWADILLVAALADPATAAVYTAASRLLLAGNFLNLAIVQAVSPMVSAALSRGHRRDAQDLLRVGTSWLVTAVWPGYLLLIAFGGTVLSTFGSGYEAGGNSIAILAAAMLIASAVGPIEAVLLMAGGSRTSLADNAAALTLNIVLNIVLIPKLGLEGAAIAWALSLLVTNLAPLAQVHHRLGIHPFGRGHVPPVTSALLLVGAPALAIRFTIDPDLLGVVLLSPMLLLAYGLSIRRHSDALHLRELTSALKGRRAQSNGK